MAPPTGRHPPDIQWCNIVEVTHCYKLQLWSLSTRVAALSISIPLYTGTEWSVPSLPMLCPGLGIWDLKAVLKTWCPDLGFGAWVIGFKVESTADLP